MVVSRGLSGIAVILIVCLFIQGAHSFFPTTWKEVIFGYGGTSHVEQTEIAFAAQAAKYFPAINHLTKSMLKARDTISDANAKVDEIQTESALHCDGENFDGVQVRLQKLHDTVVNQLVLGLPAEARISLGSALHTVQDCYAHSNWVELGNTAPIPSLGRSSTLAHAGPSDPTCSDCLPHGPTDGTLDICPNCRNNELGFMSLLTSGYYVGEDAVPVAGIAKCNHGGFTDGNVFKSITVGPSNPGINKDSLYCGWSPHYFLHNQAVAVSIAATEQYIDDLKAVITTSQLRQLFGVGPTLAFCIDTTGSMGDIIATVQDASIKIVTERLGTPDEPSTYIISPFNDPSTGPVTTTSDVEDFKSGILSLGAGGGGDCPELSMTGMIDAINVMDAESTLFMFTDAAASDFSRAGELIALAVEKSIKCYIFKFDSSCDDGVSGGSKVKRVDSASDSVYNSIALATGGGYHSLPRDAATNITSLVDSLTMSDSNFILRVTDSLPASGSAAYSVPVDSSLTQITISLRGSGTAITITGPDGSPLDPAAAGVSNVTLADGSFTTIKTPNVGSWRVEVTGTGNFSLDVTGIGPLHFSSFVFARISGRPGHRGYYPVPGSPPYNTDVAAIAAMNGPWATADFSFRLPDGSTLTTLSMIQGTGSAGDPPTNEFFTQLRLTPINRYIYVHGTDSAGTAYQRLIPTAYTPVLSNDTFPLGNITSPPSSISASSALTSSPSAPTPASSSTGLQLPIYPVYPVYPVYEGSLDSSTSGASSDLQRPTTSTSFTDSTSVAIFSSGWTRSTASSAFASHGPYTNSSSSLATSLRFLSSATHSSGSNPTNSISFIDPGVSKSTSLSSVISSIHSGTTKTAYSPSISGSLTLGPSSRMTISDVSHDSATLAGPAVSKNDTSPTYVPPYLSASLTTPPISATSSLDFDNGITVTSEVLTIITNCPVTLSSTTSGSIYTTVTHSNSTITVTRTLTSPCKECRGHSYPLTPTLNSSTTSATDKSSVVTESGLPPITVTENVYITTSTCPITISTTICSGTTSYILTPSVTTQTLTSTTTAPCDKCGPRTVTIRISSIPPTGPFSTPSPSTRRPPSYVTLHVSSIPPAYATPPTFPSRPECYGGHCGIPLNPSPTPSSPPVYSPPPSHSTFPGPPRLPSAPSIPECHGPECPGVPFTPIPGPPGHKCSDSGCLSVPLSSLTYIPTPSNLTTKVPPIDLACSGPGCSVVLPPTDATPDITAPPGNATASVPPESPTVMIYIGGIDKSLSLAATTIIFSLIITVVMGIIVL